MRRVREVGIGSREEVERGAVREGSGAAAGGREPQRGALASVVRGSRWAAARRADAPPSAGPRPRDTGSRPGTYAPEDAGALAPQHARTPAPRT